MYDSAWITKQNILFLRLKVRTIKDPESPEDYLYFVFIQLDIDDLRELARVTKLEISGALDQETMKAFTQVGPPVDVAVA